MKRIIAVDPDRLEWETFSKVEQITSLDDATDASKTYVQPASPACPPDARVLTPAAYLDMAHIQTGQQLYFDLDLYPFFDPIESIIKETFDPQGVLRLHRVVPSNLQTGWITADLYVLANLFTHPSNVWIKQTDAERTPQHVIVTVDFGGGTMGHLEYTFHNNTTAKIALEWSGIGTIIEFDSDAATPVQPALYTAHPLAYSVEKLQASAQTVTPQMRERLRQFDHIITTGVHWS